MASGHIVRRGKGYTIVLEMGNETGKRKQRWFSGYATQKIAEGELHRMLHELHTGEFIDLDKRTVGEWLDRWMRDFNLHLSPYTQRGYENIVAQVKDEIGGVPLQKLTTTRLQQMVADWQTRGTSSKRGPLSANTIRKHMICLSAALNKAVQIELIRKNPARLVSLPRIDKPDVRTLSDVEVLRMLTEAKDTALYMPVLLALTTGMRRGEIIALRWPDVDLEIGTILVRHSAVQIKGAVTMKDTKTGKSRGIALPEFLVTELDAHRRRQLEDRLRMGNRWKGGDYVCCNDDGSAIKPERLSGNFMYFSQTHGFKVSFHDLRHTHASLLLADGVNMKVTQERLGHSNLAMTSDTYSHTSTEMQRTAAATMDRLLGGVVNV